MSTTKKIEEYKQGDKVDEFAFVVAPGLVEVEGMQVPLTEYLERKRDEVDSLLARERTLRKDITDFIKGHVSNHSPQLLSLDWYSQLRQLSWALGERGAGTFDKLPKNNHIAKSNVEVWNLTHYVRAFVASLLKIEVSKTISETACAPVAHVAEDYNQMISERCKLWIEMVRMIPSGSSKDKKHILEIIHDDVKELKNLVMELIDKSG